MKDEYIALVDGEIDGAKGGMMLSMEVKKDADPVEAMMQFVETVSKSMPVDSITVTFVKQSKKEIPDYYVHPPMAKMTAEDGSVMSPTGPVWLQLILSVEVGKEEEE